jgi:hypothetical protein
MQTDERSSRLLWNVDAFANYFVPQDSYYRINSCENSKIRSRFYIFNLKKRTESVVET